MPLVIEVAVVVTLHRKQHNNIFFHLGCSAAAAAAIWQ